MDRNDDVKEGRRRHEASDCGGTAADRLRRAVSATASGAGSRDEVEGAARALIGELRGRQEGPEQMLVQIKALLAEAGLRAGYPPADPKESLGHETNLYRDIITLSIRCYYENGRS